LKIFILRLLIKDFLKFGSQKNQVGDKVANWIRGENKFFINKTQKKRTSKTRAASAARPSAFLLFFRKNRFEK